MEHYTSPQGKRNYMPEIIPSQIERAAELSAQEIIATNMSSPNLATQGARHMHRVDVTAGIIKKHFEGLISERNHSAARDTRRIDA